MNGTSRPTIAFFAAIVSVAATVALSATTGCSRTASRQDQAATGGETRYADFSATIPMAWYCREPFAIDGCEPTKGFLVVEKVKDHPTIVDSGVEVGDVCLSWGTASPEPPKTLRDAFLEYLCNNAGDDDTCWFARDRGGKVEVFSCSMGELYECMVSLGTFGLELRPTVFTDEKAMRIVEAATAAQ